LFPKRNNRGGVDVVFVGLPFPVNNGFRALPLIHQILSGLKPVIF
jgi:hypothetical protein